jgi:hypothetical protein
MYDNSPETFGVPKVSHWATRGPRRNSDGAILNTALENLFYWDIQGAATAYASANPCVNRRNPVNTATVHTTHAGSLLFVPYEGQYGATGEGMLFGRIFQTLMVDSVAGTFGAEFTVPIDTGVTGVFKVIGMTATQTWRACARKS